jgi:cyclopropane-fatty-acyl-phospholipid synthase
MDDRNVKIIHPDGLFYSGTVVHGRRQPVEHSFSYPAAWYAFNVDSLSNLDTSLAFFGHNRFQVTSLSDIDYMKEEGGTIRSKVERLIEEYGITKKPTAIYLITTPKIFGYVFNPVSFYYLYDDSIHQVSSLEEATPYCYLAEINNTYEERTIYVFPYTSAKVKDGTSSFTVKKHFHVSPFYDETGDYHVHFSPLGQSLDIRFNLHRENEKPFVARMWGNGESLDQISHGQKLLKFGVTMVMTLPRIYIQALRLLFQKKLPVFKKPNPLIPMETKKTVTLRAKPYTWFDGLCRSLVKPVLQKLRVHQLRFIYPDGSTEYFGDANSHVIGEIHIKSFKFFWKLIHSGGIGFGESFVDGDWVTPDLTLCMRVILDNDRYMHESKFNLLKPVRWFHRVMHRLRKNSKDNSQKNISDHYDLGNDMFSLFLDESMVYSSGVFSKNGSSLNEAQLHKLNLILKKAQVRPGDRVLEIGCGWGELAAVAAKEFGAHVTGITLSTEQKKIAEDKMASRGVTDSVQIQLRDYRDVVGEFDRIVSVEMIEAVGKHYLGSFFETIDRVLSPNGICVLQVIAYSDPYYKEYLGRQDWIQKHIFPGSHLPSLTALTNAMTKHSNLVVDSIENYAKDYALTLAEWRKNFNLKSKELEAIGYDARFQRAWNFYLSSCEAEFLTRWLSLYQIVLTRPNNSDFSVNDGDVKDANTSEQERKDYVH